jgi:hypothetical protein
MPFGLLGYHIYHRSCLRFRWGKVLSNQTACPYIHQVAYGGDINLGYEYGLDWYDLSETTITVHRRKDDPNWCQVRIIIRKLPERLMPREEQAKNGHN